MQWTFSVFTSKCCVTRDRAVIKPEGEFFHCIQPSIRFLAPYLLVPTVCLWQSGSLHTEQLLSLWSHRRAAVWLWGKPLENSHTPTSTSLKSYTHTHTQPVLSSRPSLEPSTSHQTGGVVESWFLELWLFKSSFLSKTKDYSINVCNARMTLADGWRSKAAFSFIGQWSRGLMQTGSQVLVKVTGGPRQRRARCERSPVSGTKWRLQISSSSMDSKRAGLIMCRDRTPLKRKVQHVELFTLRVTQIYIF